MLLQLLQPDAVPLLQPGAELLLQLQPGAELLLQGSGVNVTLCHGFQIDEVFVEETGQ